jgi:thiol-disulfide isomerase/thioredoxin
MGALLLLVLLPFPLAGQEAALSLKDLSGGGQSLSDYRGRIVVLNFWATWCAPCREEMPILKWAHKRYGPRGVEVIGASADDERTRAQIPAFVREMGIGFPIWTGATSAQMDSLGAGLALPATVILDRDGRIAARIFGPVTKADLRRQLDWLAGDRRGPAPPAEVNNFGGHAEEEDHEHGGVGLEGASTVPS